LFWWGVRVKSATEDRAEVTIPYTWRTQNPFKSVYFAAQAGAAELSTGVLVIAAIRGQSRTVSMLVTHFEAAYTKKADDTITFTCTDGPEIFAAVERAVNLDTPQTVVAETVGTMPGGMEVSRVRVTWSLRAR
ncbi:MAG: DUF4442 domain-containing protein, partial [Saprospiraceae bacterium]